jgi:hypothetical protein
MNDRRGLYQGQHERKTSYSVFLMVLSEIMRCDGAQRRDNGAALER